MIFDIIHNIPSPYRIFLFNKLKEKLSRRNIALRVHFMSSGHDERPHWKAVETKMDFTAFYWKDFTLPGRKHYLHINLGLLQKMSLHRPDYLMVGGPWNTVTGIIATFLRPKIASIAWYEGNTKTPGVTKGFLQLTKRELLKHYDFLVVPGSEGIGYTKLIYGHNHLHDKIVILPNLVDESKFIPRWELSESLRNRVRDRLGVPKEKKIGLWCARLIQEKGVLEFISNLAPVWLKDWSIIIIGQGPLKAQIESFIEQKGLGKSIILKSYVPYSEMPDIYAACDLYLLPSLNDPNPLSVVEAMHCGLPIFVSDRIGNFPEALEDGINGLRYEPLKKGNAIQQIKNVFALEDDRLVTMGRHSKRIASTFWNSDVMLESFIRKTVDRCAT